MSIRAPENRLETVGWIPCRIRGPGPWVGGKRHRSGQILPDLFEKAYCRTRRHVQRLHLTQVGNHHLVARQRQQLVRDTLPFMAEDPGHGPFQVDVEQALGGIAAGGKVAIGASRSSGASSTFSKIS